jgi:hypothetical protein
MTAGAGLLALWLVVRFPAIVPTHSHTLTAHVVGAGLVPFAVAPGIRMVGVPLGPFAALFGVALPGCVYLCLVAAFVILYTKQALGGAIGR